MGVDKISEVELAEATLAAGLLDACDRVEEAQSVFVQHLAARFGLSVDQAQSLADVAQKAANASVDAFDAAHRVNLHTDLRARKDSVRWFWELARDGNLPSNIAHTYIERVAILFEMTARDAVDLRRELD